MQPLLAKSFVMPAWVFLQIISSAIVKMFFVRRLGRLNCPSGIYEDFPSSIAPYPPDEPNLKSKTVLIRKIAFKRPHHFFRHNRNGSVGPWGGANEIHHPHFKESARTQHIFRQTRGNKKPFRLVHLPSSVSFVMPLKILLWLQ